MVASPSSFDALVALLTHKRVVVLSGAGCSTESGIPDYRGPETRKRARSPVQYDAFVRDEAARIRYWARSAVGWPRFSAAVPNAGHTALAAMEQAGVVGGIITQNVDRLHQQAGSRKVIELHGALEEVRCLGCGDLSSRFAMQERLLALNPAWPLHRADLAPDGDAELPEAWARHFRVPPCLHCGGVLKPHVVFFGENVPKPRVEQAWAMYDEAEVLLVLGSSLAVFSGYRFVLKAAKEGKPVALVNLGETRGDPHAAVKVEAKVGDLLPQLAEALLHVRRVAA